MEPATDTTDTSPSMRQYDSFLLRTWRLGGNQQRIRVEHIQSGEAIQVASLSQALDWLGTKAFAHTLAAQRGKHDALQP